MTDCDFAPYVNGDEISDSCTRCGLPGAHPSHAPKPKAPPEMDDNHWNTLQELLTAVAELPGVFDKVDAYLRGRGIEDPKAEIEALHKIAFA